MDPARGAVDSLRAQLAGRRLLLCLDNCEHVLDAVAEVADGLHLSHVYAKLGVANRTELAAASSQNATGAR